MIRAPISAGSVCPKTCAKLVCRRLEKLALSGCCKIKLVKFASRAVGRILDFSCTWDKAATRGGGRSPARRTRRRSSARSSDFRRRDSAPSPSEDTPRGSAPVGPRRTGHGRSRQSDQDLAKLLPARQPLERR